MSSPSPTNNNIPSNNTPINPPSSPSNNNIPSNNIPINPPLSPSNNNNPSVFTFTQPSILNQIIDGSGYEITNVQDVDLSGNFVTGTTFVSTNPELFDPNINHDLKETIVISTVPNTDPISNQLITTIKDYASKIKCSDFHGKGSVDDYKELFAAAANIANETKQMELDVDIDGFNDFGAAADELSNLFTSFTTRLQNVNIINDNNFLRAVSNALEKIYNLSLIFGRFKETIIATSTITVPKSVVEARNVINGVIDEVSCAMNYIGNFVNPDPLLVKAQLSDTEKNIITKAVNTIENWNILCDQGVSIALNNSSDIKDIKLSNQNFKAKSIALKSLSASLRTKLNNLHL